MTTGRPSLQVMAANRDYVGPAAGDDMNPEDFNYFRTQKWRINDSYNLGNDQNNYQRSVANNQYGRSKDDLKRQFTQMRDGLSSGFGKRGLMNSGIWQNRLSKFAEGRTAAYGNLAQQFEDQNRGFAMAESQLRKVQTNSQSDLASQEAARRAAIASAITKGLGF
jgi:hypothetical protein